MAHVGAFEPFSYRLRSRTSPTKVGVQSDAGEWTPTFAGESEEVSVDGAAYVYIMASGQNGTLYIGSTPDLPRRVWEHRNLIAPGFTKRYKCVLLVWYEQHPDLASARHREKQIKEWRRKWKLEAIEAVNPAWSDLYEQIIHG